MKSVLIVDDVEFSREILKEAVLSSDYEVNIKFSENASDAINKLDYSRFDLIIMDVMMPNGNGFELLSMMSDRLIASKIIIMSGLDKSIVSSVSMLGKLYDLDIVASLLKPIWLDQIVGLVNKALTDFGNYGEVVEKKVDAITSDDFPISLLYQPQINSDVNTVTGFEILARWSEGDGTLLPPSYFLPTIEEFGKQKLFTSIVIRKFIENYHQYFFDLDKLLRFSINVDPNLLVDESLISELLDIYNQGVQHTIVIELTENHLIETIEKDLLASVLKLRLNGFEISIDDFGIDASNLERIIKLPINEIKIDRTLTCGFDHNIDYMQKINEVKTLALVKDVRIIYEGVENKSTSLALEGIAGYHQQGFYHGVPALPEITREIMNKSRS